MAKEIKTAEELEEILESRIRALFPGAARGSLVVIVRTEEHHANWSATHSGQPRDIADAIDREVPAMQAQYELNQPGRAARRA